MRRSAYFLPTLKETPAEAQIVSHRFPLEIRQAGGESMQEVLPGRDRPLVILFDSGQRPEQTLVPALARHLI